MKNRVPERPLHSQQSGIALVIALAMIVLVTIAVVAFFSSALANRRIESSRASRVRADLLAESGGSYVNGLVLAEITDAGHSTTLSNSGVNIFEPKANANACPARFLAPSIPLPDASFINLIRQSVPSTGVASYNEANASDHNTATAASNGHALSATRWNAPHLLVGDGFKLPTQLPNWVYLNRATSVSSPYGVTGTPSANAIGRFAYNVYHTGGLLNINATGFPSGVANLPDLLAALKGYQSGADLTRLPTSPALTQSDLDALAVFRFPDMPSTKDYVSRMLAAFGNGLLRVQNSYRSAGVSVPFKQNMFTFRRDLIRYASSNAPDLLPALPYLTHTSLASNAPSWKPPAGSTNPDLANARFANGGTVTHYDDDGIATTYQVNAGDPLLQRRFSLAKLAWLNYKGPESGKETAIQATFGLRWNASEERWDYVGPSGSSPLGKIATLSDVATERREANFFELLKAGILDATLGGAPLGKTAQDGSLKPMSLCPVANNDFYAVPDLHILQIGANIIDNADADNYPTRLALQYGSVAIEKAGIEDLPYFYTIDMAAFMETHYDAAAPDPTKPYKFDSVHFSWVPELFCLHRAPASANVNTPDIEINIRSGRLRQAGLTAGPSFSGTASDGNVNKDMSALPAISVPASNFEKFRNGPQPVRDAAAGNRLGATVPVADASIQDVLAFHLIDFANKTEFHQPFPFYLGASASTALAVAQTDNLIITLRYLSPGGKMKTYSVLGGAEALPSLTGIDGKYRSDFLTPVFKHTGQIGSFGLFRVGVNKAAFVDSAVIHTWDPRTARFGPSSGLYDHLLAEPPYFKNTNAATPPRQDTMCNVYPFYPLLFPIDFLGSLPQIAAFQDSDHKTRLPDGSLGNPTNATTLKTNPANPYSDVASSTYTPARPVVLQRPFNNVAELGYVFRDVPWQTLDLYYNNYASDGILSGDGALLDLFSLADEPAASANRVFLGSPQQPVLTALASATPQEPDGTLPISATDAANISGALNSYMFTAGAPSATYPINVADFPEIMSRSNIKILSLSPIKNRREAVTRAIAGTAQTRTWNLLIDVFAQTGRFPLQKMTAGDFNVEGESHLWISVAIDRYTGKVIGQQIEKVYE